ncbi:winged helix-turn-helix domain-containing protein [Serratia inhibens]|uniref:winged helix-turn-helix domain-containing protein n=1 Tax=Serratia inhibens TaxID=2338073 RepID=UPI000693A7BA|nr:winged helix-turn-helix domain-containing protein [Serratia inhibens]ANS40619.1 Transcriptional activator CadC [Serratia inhibens PRI-2C]
MYKINGKILFDENRCLISHLTNGSQRGIVKINLPVCRCLSMLIESQGEIVSQEKFIDNVWRKNGIEVSTNTFYQNISLLRKNLKTAGINNDIIITIPKKGLKLSKSVVIEKLDSYDNDVLSQLLIKDVERKNINSIYRMAPYIVSYMIIFLFIWYLFQK